MIPNEGFFLISRLTRRQAKFMTKNETHFCFDSPSYYQGYLWIQKCLIVKTWRWFNITIHTFVTQGPAISLYGSQWTYFRWYQLIQFVTVTWVTFLKVATKTLKGQILWRCPLQLDYVSVWYRLSPDDLKNFDLIAVCVRLNYFW